MKWTPIAAIVGIVILETIALMKGINGIAFSGACVLIAGLGGYQAKILKDKIVGGKQ